MPCTNLIKDDDGFYIDPISLDAIPLKRLVHLPYRNVVLCYDALTLLRYVTLQETRGRIPRLPDNNLLLTYAGVAEIRRVAHGSMEPQGNGPYVVDEEEKIPEHQEPAPRVPRLIELTGTVAYEIRPGEWRCGSSIRLPRYYCNIGNLHELEEKGHTVSASQYQDAENVDGEEVSYVASNRVPICRNPYHLRQQAPFRPCRVDLIESVASLQPHRYINRDMNEIEYTFNPEDGHFHCRNLDDPDQYYTCDDILREDMRLSDTDVFFRYVNNARQCATREEWQHARRTNQPIPWHSCSEDEQDYLRNIEGRRSRQLDQ